MPYGIALPYLVCVCPNLIREMCLPCALRQFEYLNALQCHRLTAVPQPLY